MDDKTDEKVEETAGVAQPEVETTDTEAPDLTNEGESALEADEATEETPADDAEVDWRAEARKWEKRSKANADAAAELEKLKAEVEAKTAKFDEISAELEKLKADAAHEALLAEVSKAKGVPASALRGSTKEELEAHADVLVGLLKSSAEEKKPIPGFSSVGGGGSVSLDDQIAIAEAEKDWVTARRLKSMKLAEMPRPD